MKVNGPRRRRLARAGVLLAIAAAAVLTSGCGGGGGGSGGPPPIQPSVAIAVSRSIITVTDGSGVQLTWSTDGVTSCTASGAWSGAQAASGVAAELPTTAGVYTYTLTCASTSGNVSGTATLTVTPGITINIAPENITLGQSANVTWSAAGASACSASGAWSGSPSVSGTVAVSPTDSGIFTYALTCTANGTSATQSVSLNVYSAVILSVSPVSVNAGQAANLTWSASGASSCTASDAWTGSRAVSGSASTAPTTPGTYVYFLTCAGAQGLNGQAAATLIVYPNGFASTSLVADTTGTTALATDPSLVNPWGIAFAAGMNVAVANNGSNTSTSYDGTGTAAASSTVSLPAGAGSVPFNPTGVVANPTADFVVAAGGKSAPAQLIYVGETGMIAAWSPAVSPDSAAAVYTDTGGAEYTGVALANNFTGSGSSGNFLYAADFHNAKIDVFDATFSKQAPSASQFSFTDPTLPSGYAPYGIQAISVAGGATHLYVTYAQQLPPANLAASVGAGLGLIDVFDANGNLITHLVATGGVLNAPWGLALGSSPNLDNYNGELFVTNSGDGTVNVFDPTTGAFVATVSDSTGAPEVVPGLRAIAFGDRYANQPATTLFFTAGPGNGAHGQYGRIDFGAAPRLHAPPTVALTVSAGDTTAFTFSAAVTSTVGIGRVDFFSGTTFIDSVTSLSGGAGAYQVNSNLGTSVSATATDVDGNVGTSQ